MKEQKIDVQKIIEEARQLIQIEKQHPWETCECSYCEEIREFKRELAELDAENEANREQEEQERFRSMMEDEE